MFILIYICTHIALICTHTRTHLHIHSSRVGPSVEITPTLGSVTGVVYNDCFDMGSAERAVKHHYDAVKKEWFRTLINVVLHPEPFAEGAMRSAYHMKDLSVAGDDSRYVLKMSKDQLEHTQTYYDDVQMQMEAKMFAELYNARDPPKKVSRPSKVCKET